MRTIVQAGLALAAAIMVGFGPAAAQDYQGPTNAIAAAAYKSDADGLAAEIEIVAASGTETDLNALVGRLEGLRQEFNDFDFNLSVLANNLPGAVQQYQDNARSRNPGDQAVLDLAAQAAIESVLGEFSSKRTELLALKAFASTPGTNETIVAAVNAYLAETEEQ